jgi:acyl dehydratase
MRTHKKMRNPKSASKFLLKSIGPDAALRLASLAKDYNPLFLMPEIAKARGFPRPVLHPLWISSLVSAGLQDAAKGRIIEVLKISYHRTALQGDSLSLEGTIDRDDDSLVTFKVWSGKNNLVASGRARVKEDFS